MSTYGEAQRHARRQLYRLAALVVGVTILAVGVLGTAVNKAAKKLTVDPSVALTAGAPAADPEPKQAVLGKGSEGMLSPDAVLRRNLSRLRYDDERAVRRFLERQKVIGSERSAVVAADFADRLMALLMEDALDDLEVRRSIVAVFARFPNELLRRDPFGAFLSDPDTELRRLAIIGAHRHLRDHHWETIAALSSDADPKVRTAVADALSGLQEEVAVATLVELIRDVDANVVTAAGKALGPSLGKPLPSSLLDACQDERGSVRVAVAEALGVVGGAEAAPLLAGMTRDTDWRVRKQALRGLSRLRNDETPIAVRALEDVAFTTNLPRTDRLAALQGLAAMPELATPEGVVSIAKSDPDPILQLFAARVMLTHADLDAVGVLVSLLDVEMSDHCDEEDQEFIREAAVETLSEALALERSTDPEYFAQTAMRKAATIDRAEFEYSPVHVYEFW